MANRTPELVLDLVAMSVRCKQDMINASITPMILFGRDETD